MDYLEYRRSLAHSCIAVNGTELIHHGVPNQKWGVRKALWYPISAWKDSLTRKPKNQAKAERNQVDKENGNLPNGAHDGLTPQERVKETVKKSGDLNLVMQNKDLFTSQELVDIANRYRAETVIKDLIRQQQASMTPTSQVLGFVDKYAKYAGTVANAIEVAGKLNKASQSFASAYADYTNAQKNGGYIKNEFIRRQQEEAKKQKEEYEKKRKDYEDRVSELAKRENEANKAKAEIERLKSEAERNKAVSARLIKQWTTMNDEEKAKYRYSSEW